MKKESWGYLPPVRLASFTNLIIDGNPNSIRFKVDFLSTRLDQGGFWHQEFFKTSLTVEFGLLLKLNYWQQPWFDLIQSGFFYWQNRIKVDFGTKSSSKPQREEILSHRRVWPPPKTQLLKATLIWFDSKWIPQSPKLHQGEFWHQKFFKTTNRRKSSLTIEFGLLHKFNYWRQPNSIWFKVDSSFGKIGSRWILAPSSSKAQREEILSHRRTWPPPQTQLLMVVQTQSHST